MRKRKAKYTWLPMVGLLDDQNIEESVFGNLITLGVTAGTPLRSQAVVSPLILDRPQEPTDLVTQNPSLSDIVGSEFICKRIVGSVFAAYNTPASSTPTSALVTCGIFVARADDLVPNLPAGAATAAEVLSNFSPANLNNAREPWMWHRQWLLGNPNSTTAGTLPFRNAPITNMDYGELRSGPHVDCKSVRRVRQDERMWFAAATTNLIGDGATAGDVTVQFHLRALGQLRRAKNRSTF